MTPTAVLQPLSTGQLLDRAINLYRRHFLTFIGIVAVVQIPSVLLQFVSSWLNLQSLNEIDSFGSSADMMRVLATFPLTILFAILGLIFSQLGVAAIAIAVANHYLGGKTGIVEAYKQVKDVIGRLLAFFLWVAVIAVALYLWLLVPCVGWFTGLGMLIFYFGVVFPLAVLIVVLENQSGLGAIRRAWSLGQRRFWYMLGYVFLLSLFSWLIVIGPVLLLAGLGGDLFTTLGGLEFEWVSQIVQSVLTLLFGIFYIPLQSCAMVLVYLDLRVRTEGLDLALQVAGKEIMDEAEAWKCLQDAPDSETGRWFSSEDWQRFVILTLALIGLIVGLFVLLVALAGLVSWSLGEF